jgi:Arc/MetJ family transcription regulator
LSLWQVAKDLGLISKGMSRRGAFAFGLSGAAAAVAQLARRAVIALTLDLGAGANAAALKLDNRTGASALQPGLTFAMSNQAGGT